MSLSDWIATLSLVVTAALTIIVAQMSHRGQRQTEAILTTLGDLAAANRMDALMGCYTIARPTPELVEMLQC